MKKVFGISMTLVIVAMLLMGCGGKGKSNTATSATTSASTAVTTTKATTPAISTTSTTTSAAPTTSTSIKTTTTAASSTPATSTKTTTTAATSSAPATTSTAPTTSAAKTTTTTTTTTAASGNDLSTLIGKAGAITNFYVEIKMTSGTDVSNMKEWVKTGNPTKLRMEITAAGVGTTIMIYDGQNYYTYDPTTKYAFKISVPTTQPSEADSITQYSPEYVGSETINGIDCAIYQYTVQGVITKMWISKQNGMTIKLVSGTTTMEYSNYSFSAIADSMFMLPADAIMMTIPGMT